MAVGGSRTRILVIHQNFPGQFRHIVKYLAERSDVELVGLGRETAPGLPRVSWFRYKLHRQVKPETHPYLRQMEAAVLHGQAVARAMQALKRKGFVPDVILAHPGWGETLYAKDVYPAARLVHFSEWYYATSGADFGFDPEFLPSLDDHLRITTWNALHLLNLQNCDIAISPTHWQKSRHPEAYQNKIHVIHEGVDTNTLGPDLNAVITLANGQVLKAGDPVVTYVARNLEPYRGFHTFMRALPQVLRDQPAAQVLVVGGNDRSYGAPPKHAQNWKEKMLGEVGTQLGENLGRVHFLGKIPYEHYKKVLQVSAVHTYLTYPFVLSWSLLEAMASGCQIVASDTAPVREVIRNGENGRLVNFFDPNEIASAISEGLRERPDSPLRQAAIQSAQAYTTEKGLALYASLLMERQQTVLENEIKQEIDSSLLTKNISMEPLVWT